MAAPVCRATREDAQVAGQAWSVRYGRAPLQDFGVRAGHTVRADRAGCSALPGMVYDFQ